jgi:hypothetical protein
MPKDPHITGGIRHDWAVIKHEYVTDPDATLRKMAAKYGVNYGTIANKSKAEGWFATRKKHQSKVVSQAISRTGNAQAKELSEEADFLKLMKGHMNRMLSDQDQFQRHLVMTTEIDEQGSLSTTEEKIFDKFDARAMKDAMQTLKMIEDMSRSLYNIAKASEIQKHQLDAERLQLEREKFEFEKEKAYFSKPDSSAVIRIEGFEEGWDE